MQKIIKNIAKIAFIAAFVLPFNGAQAASPISCPLTAGSDSYIVKFPSTVLLSNNGAHDVSVTTNMPAGNYTITAVTWDDHAEHGGQNQHQEQIYLRLLSSSGTHLAYTGNSSDIPENQNSVTSVIASNLTVSSSIGQVIAKHSAYQKSSEYESVYPICVKFSRNDVTTNPPSNNLSVSCSVSDRNVETDEDVTFTANVSNGNSPFTYRWSGDVTGSSRAITESFNDEGTYRASVRVTDEDGRTASADCATVVVDDDNDNNDDDLEVQCEVSDSSIEEGDEIRISVDIDGGNGPFDIEWDGDIDEVDDFDDNAKSQRVEFEDSGRYEFEVTVEDDNGDEDSDTCVVRVSNDGNSLATTDGNLAGLSSVYLSQVPYTGVEDTAKVFGFIALIAVWSAAIAYYLLKNKTRTVVKSKIQAFKEANLARKQVRG